MVASHLAYTLHGLASCLLLLPALAQVGVAVTLTVRSSPQESPETVLIIGQRGATALSACAGTLVGSQWVLTARSCLYHNATRLTQFLVVAGGTSYEEYADRKLPPSAQLLSSYQSFANTKYDMALLRTQGAFEPNEYVRFAPMMDLPIRLEENFRQSYSRMCSVTGFGSLDSKDNGTYRIADKRLKATSPCPRWLGCSYDYYTWQKMKGEYVCSWRLLGEIPRCAATPGAGLICGGQVHGVAHTTVRIPVNEGASTPPCIAEPIPASPCGDYYSLTVFTIVYRQRRWIDEIMWPERFPHPFPGCDAFGQGVKRGGSSPIINLLVAAMLLHNS